jgi:flagellar basal body rod protein FlgC
MTAITTAASGLQAAVSRLNASAARTARMGLSLGGDIDPVRESVERIEAGAAFKANIAVIRTADQMTGALLDILA